MSSKNQTMDANEAITRATSALKASTLADLVDYDRIDAKFVSADGSREFFKANVPNIKELPDFKDYWDVSFPMREIDIYGREWIWVKVDPSSKVASIVEDL